MDAPFFSPRSPLSGNTIDWRWLLIPIGFDVRRSAPDLPDRLRALLVDKHYLYSSISSEPLHDVRSDPIVAESLTYDVLTSEEMANVVGLSLELCNSKGNMELLLVSQDHNGKLHFIPESAFVPPFGGKFNNSGGRTIDFKTVITTAIEHLWIEWRKTGEFPLEVDPSLADHLSLMKARPGRMLQDEARSIARHILETRKIPYFDSGRLINPDVGKASDDLAIPELAVSRRKNELDEGRALNPEFGALAF